MTSTTHTSPSPSTASSRSDRSLRMVLRANAFSSTIGGLVIAIAPGTLDELLDTGQPGWIRIVGIGLILFAANVVFTSTLDVERMRQGTIGIIAGDLAWVVGSIVTVIAGWYSGGGVIAVLAVAAMVDTFAVLQWRHWRHLR